MFTSSGLTSAGLTGAGNFDPAPRRERPAQHSGNLPRAPIPCKPSRPIVGVALPAALRTIS